MATWCLSETASVRADDFSQQQLEIFEKQIRPLLVEHCLQCHGPEKQEGGFNLATREALLKGGDSGAALVADKPMESLLIEAVEYLSEPKMPPSGKPLISCMEPTSRSRNCSDGSVCSRGGWLNAACGLCNSSTHPRIMSGTTMVACVKICQLAVAPATSRSPHC